MFAYDAAILGLLQTPPQSVTDVLRILQGIDATCADTDGLKWFNWLYVQVTEAVAARVAAGGFRDPAWLALLDVQFARFYFSALQSFLSGRTPAQCWQVACERRTQPDIARVQFALAGANAHINHDLAEAIVATCRLTGTTPDRASDHYADYAGLNGPLDALIEAAKVTLRVRLPGDALPPLSNLEDTLAAWNMTAARESAWQNAGHLWRLEPLPLVARSFLDVLDGLTTVIGKALLVPVPLLI